MSVVTYELDIDTDRQPMTRLTTATSRRNLTRGKRFFDVLAPGVALVYRRGTRPGVDGTWSLRTLSRAGSSGYTLEPIAAADDITEADGVSWLTYRQACEIALGMAKATEATAKSPLTVGELCEDYALRLGRRQGGRQAAQAALRTHLGGLAERQVSSLDHAVLASWAHSRPRYAAMYMRAALNLAPVSIRPSSTVLSALKEHLPSRPRGLIEAVMGDREVARIVAKARRHDPMFGAFVATMASSGCRPGQLAKCRVGDLLVKERLLIVPPSAKGKPSRPKPASRMPIDDALVRELAALAAGKDRGELLFTRARYVRAGGMAWHVDGVRGWTRNFWGAAAREAGFGRRIYDLRHAAIVRWIQAGVALRVIASKLDTSTSVIEHTYSRWIGDASDELMRRSLPKRLEVI